MNTRAIVLATAVGSVLQVGMVVLGHFNSAIAGLFAVGGMGISLLAGVSYAAFARSGSFGSLAAGGAIAGAVCALIGIFVSYLMGDVPASLLVLGSLSSAVTGAVGGAVGRLFAGDRLAVRR
jgi:hypothetical protein